MTDVSTPARFSRRAVSFALLALFLMDLVVGWATARLPSTGPGAMVLLQSIGRAVLSPGFLLLAGAEMTGLTVLYWKAIPSSLRVPLSVQSALFLLLPTAIPVSGWATWAVFPVAFAIVGLFVYLLFFAYRNRQIEKSVAGYLILLVGSLAVLSAGLFFWSVYGFAYLLAIAVGLQAAVFVRGWLCRPAPEGEPGLLWQFNAFWTFRLLLSVVAAELFLGATLDARTWGAQFLGVVPFLPLDGNPLLLVGHAFYNLLWFLAATSISAWFLILLGVCMGALVVPKFRTLQHREQKIRLALMMGAFAVAGVYIPSMWTSTPLLHNAALANWPVLGWGMGLRTGGPFATSFFAGILVMYALVGSLSVLFGRRAICSVMCGAAMMFQGTTISAMTTFNRSSRIGRIFLGSRFSTAFTVTSSLALVSLVGISVLPYLHLLNASNETLILPFLFYFGTLWIVMFVSIPYVGNYNCSTTGFCHWGSLSMVFSRVGFMRVQAKDPAVCRACTTYDCAKACPVALVDMPLQLQATGQFRSAKCIGAGECIEACPYDNLYIHDVRHWVRQKLWPSRTVDRPLPVVQPTASPTRSSAPVRASESSGPSLAS
jgi:NAD-dependent dihydropyrimidine dehydrogenase PreA subunit